MKNITITALIAACVSMLSGLIGGVDIPSILLRAFFVLIFFAIFSVVVSLVFMTFLTSGTDDFSKEDGDQPESGGSRVNIVLKEENDDVLSGLYSEQENSQEGDQESSLPNDKKSEVQESGNMGVSQLGGDLMDIDTLPDLGSFTTTFSSAENNEEKKYESEPESGYNEGNSFSSGGRKSSEGLAGTIAKQNSPEDLAKAVKTILKKEETG